MGKSKSAYGGHRNYYDRRNKQIQYAYRGCCLKTAKRSLIDLLGRKRELLHADEHANRRVLDDVDELAGQRRIDDAKDLRQQLSSDFS
jgi:hypothetical protein